MFSYWRKYVHEVLINRLGGLSLPRKSVVRLNDRGRKTTMQHKRYVASSHLLFIFKSLINSLKNQRNMLISALPVFHRGDFRFTLRPCVRPSERTSVRPSAKSGSCDNLKSVWSLLMKFGKWTNGKVKILLFVHPQ